MTATRTPQRILLFVLALCLMLPLLTSAEDTTLDLSGKPVGDVQGLIATLAQKPGLTRVNLDKSGLSLPDMKLLVDTYPNIAFYWTLDMFGIPVTSDDTYIDLGKTKIERLSQLKAYLDVLPRLTRIDMFDTRLQTKAGIQLFEEYPHICFGATIWLYHRNMRTDTEVVSLHYRRQPEYKSPDFEALKYFPDVRALDLGHNDITDVSFLRYMPKLRVLILADNLITDITPIADLKELYFLELFMNKITDVSPLANLPELLDLNLCYNDIQDATPLLTLTQMERCWFSHANLPKDQQEMLVAGLPNCEFNFTVRLATHDGWREHPRFPVLRQSLNSGIYTDWPVEEPEK